MQSPTSINILISFNPAYLPQEEDTIRLDLEELGKEAGNYGKQLEAVELAIEQAKETLSKLQEEASGTKVRTSFY